jgi:hypothetical protein
MKKSSLFISQFIKLNFNKINPLTKDLLLSIVRKISRDKKIVKNKEKIIIYLT